MLIGDTLTANAKARPDATALIFGERRLTWRELNAGANRVSNAMLKLGARPGDRVVYPLENGVEFVEIFYGLAKIGVIGAPVMANSVGVEIAHTINDLGARFVICGEVAQSALAGIQQPLASLENIIGIGKHQFAGDYSKIVANSKESEPEIKAPWDRDDNSYLSVKYTSGTTGTPKGCIKTHRQLLSCCEINLYHLPFGVSDVASIGGPMAAGANLSLLALYVLSGSTIVLLPRFDATQLLQSIQQHRISIVHASQSTFTRFTGHTDLGKYDLSSVRYYSGSSPVGGNQDGMARLRANKTFTARFFCAFASTEAGGRITYLLPDEIDAASAPGGRAEILESVGRAAHRCQVESMDEAMRPMPPGEIGLMAVKAPQVFAGYWNQPEQTREAFRDGWFLTGDLLKKDAEGYLYLSGRSRDVVRTGGINVYPAEIEPVLRAHPKVKAAAVIGVPHADWGEMVVACVVADPTCTEVEIIDYCRERLAPYKRPKAVQFVAAFPENQVGKVLKRELREQIMASMNPR
ncbi:MAG: class I adenylate-forming enzyme family protein [Burkholderiales bacterium]